MTAHHLDAPDVLIDGAWLPNGRATLCWTPTDEQPRPDRDSLHLLVACPTCRAKVDQSCRSTGGNPRVPHATRLAPRLCPCGAVLAFKKQMCPPCAAEARRQTYRLREARVSSQARRTERGRAVSAAAKARYKARQREGRAVA